MQRFIARRFKDVTWYVPAGQEALLERLEDLGKFSEGVGINVLKKGRRKSFACLETKINGGEVYLKTFHLKSIPQQLKHLFFKSKALRELEVSLAARDRGVPVVLPLAAGERRQRGLLQESYLLIQKLPNALDLLEYFHTEGTTHGHKARVIEALGRLSRKIHDEGILQEDFSLNNFLLVPYQYGMGLANPKDSPSRLSFHKETSGVTPPLAKVDGKQIFLIDFERARVRKKLSTKEREWTLAKLNRIGADLTLSEKFRFLRAYCKTREEFRDLPRWKRLEKYTCQILKKDAQRISDACVRAGRGYKFYKDDRLTGYFLEEYPLEELLALALTNQELQEKNRGQCNVLRRRGRIGKGATVEPVIIYEFNACQKGMMLATRAWQGANGLLKGYFPVSSPVAAIEWKQKERYRGTLLLKELEKAEDIRDVLHKCASSAGKRYSVLWHAARFLSRLHNFGTFADNIFPGDISWVEDRTMVHKLFLTQPFNFLVKKCLENGDREIDLKRLRIYLQDILTREEEDYFREQYRRYNSVIS